MSSTIVNKKAGFNYFLKDHIEAGIGLTGGEVKSARAGSVRLDEAYIRLSSNEAYLVNAYIAPYKFALDLSYDPKRERKLLLNKAEIEFLAGKLGSGGLTIVPTKMYNAHNLIKLEIALGTPKKKTDKRDSLKKKDMDRETESALRDEKLKNQ